MQREEHRSAAASLRVHLLGDFRLEYDGAALTTVNTLRLQSLLAYLVLHRDARQSRAHLAFLLWPDSTEAQARTNLRKQIHLLRKALPDAERFLHTDAKTVGWLTDAPFTLDVAAFERALERAQVAGETEGAREHLEQAVALYRGDLLPSCYDDWILPLRERLRQRFTQALAGLTQLLEERRDYGGAIRYARRLLRHDPLHEATYRGLMRLHALNGNRGGALRAYHICAETLGRELGVGPSGATQEAYERLVRQEGVATPAPPKVTPTAPLVGREEEWGQLLEVWRRRSGPRSQLVLLSGEAGIGKTRLAEELLSWAGRQGIAGASARCYASGGELAYAPVATWLRADPLRRMLPELEPLWLTEVARLLPELLVEYPELPAPGPLSESWQRVRLFEALARPFLTQRQLLLLIDDLHWCDNETLEWLSHLLRTSASRESGRLLVLATLRTEEMTDEPQLATLFGDLRRGRQLIEVELGRLGEREAVALAAHVVGWELERELGTAVYRETEGNPLFVVETARAGLAGREAGSASDWPLPPTVAQVITTRLEQVSAKARELAGVAATIGRGFSFEVLAQASGEDEETLVRGLEELWGRRVVREGGGEEYDFSHDKIREVLYEALSAARRRLLHRRVAQALEAVHADDLDRFSGQIATHYERAGQPKRAIAYYRVAAEAAKGMYASQEAIGLFRQAVRLLENMAAQAFQGDACHKIATEMYESLGDVLALAAQYDGARQAYKDALAHAPADDPIWMARLMRQIGNAYSSQYRLEEALKAYQRAETTLGSESPERLPEWQQEWLSIQIDHMWLYYYWNRPQQIDDMQTRLGPVLEEQGSQLQHLRVLSLLSARNLRIERYTISQEILSDARRALAIAQEMDDAGKIAHSRFRFGFVLLWYGDLDRADAELRSGLRLAEQIGNLTLQIQCMVYLAIEQRKRGLVAAVKDLSSETLTLTKGVHELLYEGTVNANLAWTAWREGRPAEVKTHAHEALALWQTAPTYPFKWTALWPLLAVALAHDRIDEAVECARGLLDPAQQALPAALSTALENGLQAWDANEGPLARCHLSTAVELAAQHDYI